MPAYTVPESWKKTKTKRKKQHFWTTHANNTTQHAGWKVKKTHQRNKHSAPSLKKVTLAAAIVCVMALIMLNVQAIVSPSQHDSRVESSGSIYMVNIEVYWDEQGTPITEINWDAVLPGDSVTKTVFVNNTSTVAMELSLTTENWNPPILAQYMNVTWDCEGRVLERGESTWTTVTLFASNELLGSNITDYAVDLVFRGTGL